MSAAPNGRIARHRLADRVFHWVNAAAVLVLLVTGFLPVLDVKFDWVTVHWVAGLVVIVAVLLHIAREVVLWRIGAMWAGPGEMARAARASLRQASPEAADRYRPGKYSVAQVLFHHASSLLILVTIGTGLVMLKGIETPFWERDPLFVSEATRGIMFVLHGFAALLLVTMIMLHIYFALRPEKLYFTRSMLLGWITREEYSAHHDPEKWKEPTE